jgi:hypothetical protein
MNIAVLMGSFAGMVGGCALGILGAWLFRRWIRTRERPGKIRAVNEVGGLVLPVPTDPRWRLDNAAYRIGPIVVRGFVLYVDENIVPGASDYCVAVREEQDRLKARKLVELVDRTVSGDERETEKETKRERARVLLEERLRRGKFYLG